MRWNRIIAVILDVDIQRYDGRLTFYPVIMYGQKHAVSLYTAAPPCTPLFRTAIQQKFTLTLNCHGTAVHTVRRCGPATARAAVYAM